MNKPEERCHWCGTLKNGDFGVYKEYDSKYIFWFCTENHLKLWLEKYKVKTS